MGFHTRVQVRAFRFDGEELLFQTFIYGMTLAEAQSEAGLDYIDKMCTRRGYDPEYCTIQITAPQHVLPTTKIPRRVVNVTWSPGEMDFVF